MSVELIAPLVYILGNVLRISPNVPEFFPNLLFHLNLTCRLSLFLCCSWLCHEHFECIYASYCNISWYAKDEKAGRILKNWQSRALQHLLTFFKIKAIYHCLFCNILYVQTSSWNLV